MLKDLAELIAIESVMDEAKPNAPFGETLRSALDWFLEKAASYGLKTGELDGYCGYAEYGEGEKLIGILGHLDIVPAGEGWNHPPYRLTIEDGYLYGRGVVDNKGCIIIALHILKDFKEKGVKLNGRVRLIVGCNEENGSLCMKHYAKHGEMPDMSIVPDADFPIINSEKGILHLKLTCPADKFLTDNFISINAGERPNVVPDRAYAKIKKGSPLHLKIQKSYPEILSNPTIFPEYLKEKFEADGHNLKDLFIQELENEIVIKTKGIAGHAMAPKQADNAAYKTMSFLTALNASASGESTPVIFELFSKVSPLPSLDIEYSDEKSGALTLNLGIIKYEKNNLEITLDVRLPVSVTKDEIIQKLKAKFPLNSKLEIEYFSPNLYMDENSPLIKTLLEVYCECTKKPAKPVQTGGGTYAKTLKNSVAFGPTFPGISTNIHNADECFSVENFYKLLEIYSKAILRLDRLEIEG